MSDVYELTPSMRVLLCMHNMSAIDANSAKKTEDLTCYCNMGYNDLEKALCELVDFGYIVKKDHIYYLSSLGISVVRGVYT
jgi:predicted transcriptional regulator